MLQSESGFPSGRFAESNGQSRFRPAPVPLIRDVRSDGLQLGFNGVSEFLPGYCRPKSKRPVSTPDSRSERMVENQPSDGQFLAAASAKRAGFE